MTTHDSVGAQPTPDANPSGQRGLSRALLVTAVVALVLLTVAVVLSTARPPTRAAEGTTPTSTPAPVPTPAITAAAGEITPDVADATVAGFLTALATTEPSDLPSIASGAILEDLQNEAQELEANDWTRTGTAKVDGVTVLDADEKSATVEACVDSSKVATVDENGNRLGEASVARALTIYSLSNTDGSWRIVSRTFPDETAC